MKYIFFLAFLPVFLPAFSQDFFYKGYDWDKYPTPYEIRDTSENKYGVLFLVEKKFMEYTYNKRTGDLERYETQHRRVKILNEEGLEEFNKIYISLYSVIEILDLKARSISKTGVVHDLDKSEIREVENLENKGDFKQFAIEGLEIGGEVEYIYTLRKEPLYFWWEHIQAYAPQRNVEIYVISPINLEFAGKVVNDTTPVRTWKDEELKRRYMQIKYDYVPPYRKEKYAANETHLMRLEAKLLYNHSSSLGKLFTYAKATESFLEPVLPQEFKPSKRLVKMVKSQKLDGLDPKVAVRKIESFLRNSISLVDGQIPNESIDFILDKNLASTAGFTRLLAETFRIMGLDVEIVWTCNRASRKLDSDFENWSYLDEMLIYLPALQLYLEPGNFHARAGFVDPELAGNNGLFMRYAEIGGYKTVKNEVKKIPTNAYTDNYHNIYWQLKFSDDLTQMEGDLVQEFGGYTALPWQTLYRFIDDEQKKAFQEALVHYVVGENALSANYKIENTEEENLYNDPLIMKCSVYNSTIIENAGDKYLVKVGELIGQQMEFYSEENRKYPVENEYNKHYKRGISITIPDGYTFKNVSDLNFNVTCEKDGQTSCAFISGYTIEGNVLKITIDEYYKEVLYSLEYYQDFRKVINAAADFNKVALVLERK